MQDSSDIYNKDEPPSLARRRRRRDKSFASSKGALVDFPDTQIFQKREERVPGAPGERSASSHYSDPYHHHHHHRRRSPAPRRAWADIANRLIWLTLALAMVVYVIVLLTLQFGRSAKKDAPPAPPPPPAATPAVEASVVDGKTAANQSTIAKFIHERIQIQRKALQTIKDARRLANAGNLSAAAAHLEEALAANPTMIDLKIPMAEIFFRQKEYSAALELLIQILDVDPLNRTAKDMLGEALVRDGNYPAALEMAEWILEDDKNSTRAHQLAATALLNMDNTTLAIPHLKSIVLYDPDDAVARNNLGVAYARAGVYNEAIAVFNELLEQNAANAVTYYNLAASLAKQSKPESAVDTLRRASRVFGPGFVAAWIGHPDFNEVRESAPFKKLSEDLQHTAPSPDARTAQLQLIDPLHSTPEASARRPEDLFPLRH